MPLFNNHWVSEETEPLNGQDERVHKISPATVQNRQ